MPTLLIVEDDENMRTLTVAKLEKHYNILSASNGVEALDLVDNNQVHLIVPDIMMPKMNGYDFIRELRDSEYNMPVILVTAKQSFNDKRDGFEVGADDYMTKPINFEELVWRINALLRRAKIAAEKEIIIGNFKLNATNFEVTYNDEPIELTKKEFELIFKLLSYPNKLFSNDKLLMEIWGFDTNSYDTTIRTHINKLRNKLEKVHEFEIVTLKGIGYKAVIRK